MVVPFVERGFCGADGSAMGGLDWRRQGNAGSGYRGPTTFGSTGIQLANCNIVRSSDLATRAVSAIDTPCRSDIPGANQSARQTRETSMETRMAVLVTGSAGHLGEALMRTLRARGHQAFGIDLKPSAYTDIVGSITDRGTVRQAVGGVRSIIHAATLHKPHVETHSNREFLDVNIAGTLNLLEAAVAAGIESFIFTSTTSAFGAALTPHAGEPAAWITEDVVPVPRNIYGVTKTAAEGFCELFARKSKLSVVVLRTSRFFPESDDDGAIRSRYSLDNAQANELLYRRVELADAVEAHLLAIEKAPDLRFARYIISASTPFTPGDLAALRSNAPSVVHRLFPKSGELYRKLGWTMFPGIDRVYDNALARRQLGWRPACDFQHVLDCLDAGKDWRSPLATAVGSKGYHDVGFGEQPYPAA
jgi:UDP-glucose 4-epimerase